MCFVLNKVGEEPDDHFGANLDKSAMSTGVKFHKDRRDKQRNQNSEQNERFRGRKGKQTPEGDGRRQGSNARSRDFGEKRKQFGNSRKDGDQKGGKWKHNEKDRPHFKKHRQG